MKHCVMKEVDRPVSKHCDGCSFFVASDWWDEPCGLFISMADGSCYNRYGYRNNPNTMTVEEYRQLERERRACTLNPSSNP